MDPQFKCDLQDPKQDWLGDCRCGIRVEDLDGPVQTDDRQADSHEEYECGVSDGQTKVVIGDERRPNYNNANN